jgi:hypothetical protein
MGFLEARAGESVSEFFVEQQREAAYDSIDFVNAPLLDVALLAELERLHGYIIADQKPRPLRLIRRFP